MSQQDVGDGVQLEGVRRQLPRGISHPGGTSRAPQGARVRRVSRRAAPLLLHSACADARRSRRQCASVTIPRDGRGEARVLLALPERDAQLYMGQMQTNAVTPSGHERCGVIFEWFREPPAAGRRTDALDADDRVQRRDPGRGHRDLRGGTEEPAITRV